MYSGRTVWSTRVQQQPLGSKQQPSGGRTAPLRATFATKNYQCLAKTGVMKIARPREGAPISGGLVKTSPWGLIYDQLPNRYAIFTGVNRESKTNPQSIPDMGPRTTPVKIAYRFGSLSKPSNQSLNKPKAEPKVFIRHGIAWSMYIHEKLKI
jgi:hypothetical protein